MVFNSRTYTPGDLILENQFIGFNKTALGFIDDALLPEMYATIIHCPEEFNGLAALYRALQNKFPQGDEYLLFLTVPKREAGMKDMFFPYLFG